MTNMTSDLDRLACEHLLALLNETISRLGFQAHLMPSATPMPMPKAAPPQGTAAKVAPGTRRKPKRRPRPPGGRGPNACPACGDRYTTKCRRCSALAAKAKMDGPACKHCPAAPVRGGMCQPCWQRVHDEGMAALAKIGRQAATAQ